MSRGLVRLLSRVPPLCAVVPLALACGGLEIPLPEDEPVVLEPIEPAPAQPRPGEAPEPIEPVELDDRIDLVLHEGRGDDGPVVLQFSDWRCPHCFRALPRIQQAAESAGAQLRFRTFPLAGPCNPTIERQDPVRCALALGAVCAARTDRFADFAARAEHEEGLIETLSGEPLFAACMQDDETAAIVGDQARSGTALELVGTPTFFVRIDDTWYRPSSVEDVLGLLERAR